MIKKMKFERNTIQGSLAIASFTSGVLIACVCIFFIEPIGEIASSAISIVSELLVLCGALLGIKSSYDHKLQKFESQIENLSKNENQTA